jgi:hypothetical protein
VVIFKWDEIFEYSYCWGNMEKRFRAKFFVPVSLYCCVFQANAARRYQQNQDVIVDTVVVQNGLSDCQRCYDVINPILDRYKRPITVLDLGAGQGYFSFRIAHDYDSTCVMIEDNNDGLSRADQLLNLCHLNARLQNIVLLNKKLSLQELEKLADCEHFDVVLAFDYIDHNAGDWRQTVNAILRLGDNIFVQVPWSEVSSENTAKRKVVECLAERSGKLILQSSSACEPKIQEQLFWFEYHKNFLNCKNFAYEPKKPNMDVFRIDSSYSYKTFFKNYSAGVEWKKGINLVTFLMLNGAYPARESIKQTVANLTLDKLTDFTPWNLIIQGDNLVLIDQSDKGWRVNIKKSLRFINETIDQSSAQGVLALFKKFPKRRVRKHG